MVLRNNQRKNLRGMKKFLSIRINIRDSFGFNNEIALGILQKILNINSG